MRSFAFVLILLGVTACHCFQSRPAGVPETAEWNEPTKRYFLGDEIDGKPRLRVWTKEGVLVTLRLGSGPKAFVERYSPSGELIYKGRIEDRARDPNNSLRYSNKKISIPSERPVAVPASAIFNRGLNRWEAGNSSNSKKNGKWLLWHRNGRSAGYVHYRNGKIEGELLFLLTDGKTPYLRAVYHADGKITKIPIKKPETRK